MTRSAAERNPVGATVLDGSIYDWPQYYDLVYGTDWKAETDFLIGCIEEYVAGVDGVPPQRIRLFEPACGTGRLLYRLARRGFNVAGLDLNRRAVDYCNRRLARVGADDAAFVGDMCDFTLPHPQDLAFNTISSFRHLQSDRLALRHLQCMAEALRPGGIYVLGFHLTPTVGDVDEDESWTSRRGQLSASVAMWLIDRETRKRLERYAIEFDIRKPSAQLLIRDEIVFRMWTLKQFERLLRQVPELEIAEVFDFGYDLDSPILLNGAVQDAVFLLRKR